jgi:hypothetical protein
MQPFPLMNRATLNVKEAKDGGAISRGLEFCNVHVLNFIISNLILIVGLLDTEQMPLRLACASIIGSDCGTVDICYCTS